MGLLDFARNNNQALMQTGMGLLSGQTGSQQAAMGAQGFMQGKQQNKTLQFLAQQNPELAQAVQQGIISPQDAVSQAFKMKQQSSEPERRAQLAKQYGMQEGSPEFQQFALTGNYKAGAGAGGEEYGLNPQYGVDAQGNPVLMQLSKSGKAQQTPLPEGVTLSKEPIKLDAGTHYVLLDPVTRQQVGIIPKQNEQAAFDTGKGSVEGKAAGEAGASYDSMQSKMAGLEQVVSELDTLADKATYTAGGQAVDFLMKETGMEPRDAAIARSEYIAKVDNQVLPLLRDTFGAAFTVKEGESLRATLGDPNKTPAEKKAVLRAFIEQKKRNLQADGIRAGRTSSPQTNGTKTSTGVSWSIE